MGNTILQNLARNQSGLLLVESFESTNFASDQGWTVLNGAPTISNVVSFSGLFSLIMDSSYPQIQKTFSTTYNWSAGYFYDDATVVTGAFKPFIIWKDTTGPKIFGLGVDNTVSTGFYTKIVSGVSTATTVARTTGWKRFQYSYQVSTSTLTLRIGSTVVSSTVIAAVAATVIQVGATVYSGAPIFGYFDLIQATTNQFLKISGLTVATPGDLVSLYNSSGTLITSGNESNGSISVDVASALGIDQPFDGFITVAHGALGPRPFYQGSVVSFSAGDEWTLNTFDLGRRVPSFGKPRMAARSDLESTSGKNQSLFYFSRDKVTLTLSDLTDDQVQTLQRWWGNAQTGAVFSAAIDSDDLYFQKLTANTAGPASSITVPSVAGVNKNSQLMLTRDAGLASEVAKVLSAAATTVTFVAPLLEQYLIGDAVRHAYYWPFCITTDQAFDPRLINPKLKRWTVTISFKEAL